MISSISFPSSKYVASCFTFFIIICIRKAMVVEDLAANMISTVQDLCPSSEQAWRLWNSNFGTQKYTVPVSASV